MMAGVVVELSQPNPHRSPGAVIALFMASVSSVTPLPGIG
jgi:hypothetical protein